MVSRQMRLFCFLSFLLLVTGFLPSQSTKAQDASQRLVESVDVVGNRRLRREDILYYVQTRPGDSYDAAQVQRDLLSLLALGFWGSIPLLAGMAGDVVGGWLSDLILKRTGNARLARRGVAAPAFLLAGVFVVPAAMVEDATISIVCLATSFFFLEWVIGPAWAVPMDVGGQFSGTVTGVMNMAGALAASLTPIVYGTLFGRGYWVAPFLVSAGVMTVGAVIWIFLIDPEKTVVSSEATA